MAIPAPEKITEIIGPCLAHLGLDVEDVKVVRAGAKSQVVVAVDSDQRPTLDVLEAATEEISAALDAAESAGVAQFGAQAYTLEVSTPGIDAPLTELRHWRRNRTRKANIRLHDGTQVIGRIGALNDDETSVVVLTVSGPKGRPRVSALGVELAQVATAVVEIEFSPAPAAELEIASLNFDDALVKAGGIDK